MALTYYRRNLPHILPPGETIFVTFRLAGSIPTVRLAQWRTERQQRGQSASYGHTDSWLDSLDPTGPTWLGQPEVAALVEEAIHYRDGTDYTLWAYCLMPNHVHMIVTLPKLEKDFSRTMQSLKARTARAGNRLLGRSGPFWQDESYDHVIRNPDEMRRTVQYVVNNPVAAGLAEDWTQWPYTYLTPDW